MNLNKIANGVVTAVNPNTKCVVKLSTGSTTNPDGTRVPTFDVVTRVRAQVQPLTWRDLQMLEGLNLQGTRRAIYLNGEVDGLDRVSKKGGDLVVIPGGVNSGVWMVAQVLEQWPGWVKAACTLQNEAP